jgi:hypothetical protein
MAGACDWTIRGHDMNTEPLFDYYGIHLTGLVIYNGDEPEDSTDTDEDEPELEILES